MALALRLEPSRELSDRGRLARALQADHHYFYRRLDLQIELARRAAHRVLQLGRDELYQMLLGRERAQHFGAERFAFDVGFEQREPDLAQRIFDIALGDPALALEFLENSFEAVAERIKHG